MRAAIELVEVAERSWGAHFSGMKVLNHAALFVLAAACAGKPAATAPAPEPAAHDVFRVRLNDPAGIAKARRDSARLPYTAADIAFMTGMISHHAQAIKMSNWAPDRNASDAVRRLTARIINAQTDEIVIMQQWLADRNQPVPEPNPAGMVMKMGDHEMHHLMPGMLSDDQMAQLQKARGKEFDRLFLTFMIQHHKGAVSMVQELFATPGAGQDEIVFKFASDVHTDQTTEIARMERMLEALKP
jgi:uncharacterized protein (DUF305 family)